MRKYSALLALCPTLNACFPNAASSDRVDDLEDQLAEIQQQLDDMENMLANRVTVLSEDMEIRIPTDQPDLQAALDWLSFYAIGPDATVTLRLESGTHTIADTVEINHRDGARIAIVGDDGAELASEVEIAILVANGNTLGLLENVTIVYTASGLDTAIGLYARDNGTLVCGDDVNLSGFSPEIYPEDLSLVGAIAASRGGVVVCDGVVLSDNTIGATAVDNGIVRAKNASISGSYEAGVYTRSAGFADVEGAEIADTFGHALFADIGGDVYAHSAQATEAANGVLANPGAVVDIHSGQLSGYTTCGLCVQYGYVHAAYASFEGISGSTDVESSWLGLVNVSSATFVGDRLVESSAQQPAEPSGYVIP